LARRTPSLSSTMPQKMLETICDYTSFATFISHKKASRRALYGEYDARTMATG
jgi:hypothetical protein